MITEDYCSYEVAKLLKEKGFDEVCWRVYQINEKELLGTDGIPFVNHEVDEDLISVPTLSLACKWLREVYDIHISVNKAFLVNDIDDKTYLAQVCTKECHTSYNCWQEYHRTYEEAVEAALKYALENLI